MLVKHGVRASGESRVGWTLHEPPATTIRDVGGPRKEQAVARTTRTFGGMRRAGDIRSGIGIRGSVTPRCNAPRCDWVDLRRGTRVRFRNDGRGSLRRRAGFLCIGARGGGVVLKSWSGLIDPGRDIPADATLIHGISTERARDEGMPLSQAIALVTDAVVSAGRAVCRWWV